MRDAYRKALETPADENMFRQLRLNQWVKQSVRWMPMDKWDECGGVVEPYELEGKACYAGLDLSSTSDLTTLVLVFPPDVYKRQGQQRRHSRAVFPDEAVRKNEVRAGHIIVIEGIALHVNIPPACSQLV